MILLSQNDPKWKSKKLGFSNVSIGDFGCTLTCISMLWNSDPVAVNDWMKNNGGFADLNLIYWAKLPGFKWRGWTYENAKVKEAIAQYGACIVETDFNTNPKDGSHFVVAIGNGQIYDPWDGKQKALNSYPVFYGYAIMDPHASPIPPQNPVADMPIKERDFLIGRATTLKELSIFLELPGDPDQVSLDTLKKSYSALKGRAEGAEGRLTVAEEEIKNRIEQVGKLEGRLLDNDKLIKDLYNKLKQTTPDASKIIEELHSKLTATTIKLDEESKAKGRVLLELAAEKAKKDYKTILTYRKLFLGQYK